MDFRPLATKEREDLIRALRSNAEENKVLLINRRNTSFAGVADEITDDEVVTAIRSVPCHY